MAEKVTKMLIRVDLQCGKCYRKIKKVLCSFPEIRDQIYDEKQNTVTITVVCCCPEKFKAKICCKGGDTILGIEIIPDKPKETEKKKEPEQKKEPEKPKETKVVFSNVPPQKKPPPPPKPDHGVGKCCCPPCYQGYGPCCCPPCYGGYGPCCYGYGRPVQLCHDGCGRPACECQGRNRSCCVSRCGNYFSDENASGCVVM